MDSIKIKPLPGAGERDKEQNMKYKLYDKEDLKKKLESLTGDDFTEAEALARADGDRVSDIIMSRRFYAAVAARAYKVPLEDIKGLKIQEYVQITGDVGNFLLGLDSASELEQPSKSGKSA